MTDYLSIFKSNVTFELKERIFKALESLGYKLVVKNVKVGPKLDINVWIAVNGDDVIVYSTGCFTKKNNLKDVYFTESEYNIIKEAK